MLLKPERGAQAPRESIPKFKRVLQLCKERYPDSLESHPTFLFWMLNFRALKEISAFGCFVSYVIFNTCGTKAITLFNTVTNFIKMGILCFISVVGVVLLVVGKRENLSMFENTLDYELPDALQTAEAIQVFYAFIEASLLISIVGKSIDKNIGSMCKYLFILIV